MRAYSTGLPVDDVGFLGLGKKDKEHQETKRRFEVADMKRKEAAAAADAEMEALERKIKMAELQKRAREAGLPAAAAPAEALAAAGYMVIGNVYDLDETGYAGEEEDYATALRAIKAIHRGWHRDAETAGFVVIGNVR